MKKKGFDAPRAPSLWPEPKITKDTDAMTVIRTIPDYIDRAREGLLCVESRCSRSDKLESIARQIRAMLPTLEEWRKEVESVIADGKPKLELF